VKETQNAATKLPRDDDQRLPLAATGTGMLTTAPWVPNIQTLAGGLTAWDGWAGKGVGRRPQQKAARGAGRGVLVPFRLLEALTPQELTYYEVGACRGWHAGKADLAGQFRQPSPLPSLLRHEAHESADEAFRRTARSVDMVIEACILQPSSSPAGIF
jgi:hypothetical protein